MLRDRSREKLIQTIVYLAHHTKALGKTKLFKLLYLIDFEHFRQTGRSVTGMEYRAWKMGPVPIDLAQEWMAWDVDQPLEPDLADAITIKQTLIHNYARYEVIPKVQFDPRYFTKRELALMSDISKKYHDALSGNMIDVTHEGNGAWVKVWANGAGKNRVINYELAIPEDDPHREAILKSAAEYQAICAAHTESK